MNKIFYKRFLFIIVIFLLNSSCSTLHRLIYHHDINQGNYFTSIEVSKIHLGMNKKQIEFILGLPIIKDSLNSNIWHYIFRRNLSNYKLIIQRTLILTFNNNNVLIDINDNSFVLDMDNN